MDSRFRSISYFRIYFWHTTCYRTSKTKLNPLAEINLLDLNNVVKEPVLCDASYGNAVERNAWNTHLFKTVPGPNTARTRSENKVRV